MDDYESRLNFIIVKIENGEKLSWDEEEFIIRNEESIDREVVDTYKHGYVYIDAIYELNGRYYSHSYIYHDDYGIEPFLSDLDPCRAKRSCS